MSDEWFRSAEWSEEAQHDFERRLGRARAHNRPQYLRIKGLALAEAGASEAAHDLWQRVLDDTTDLAWLDRAAALEHLADSVAASDPALSESYYRRLLTEYPDGNGTSGLQQVKLAELLLRLGEAGAVEARDLLERWIDGADSPFPSDHFRWQVAVMRLADVTGDREAAREAASAALDLLGSDPAFPRHPTIGVPEADTALVELLHRTAADHD